MIREDFLKLLRCPLNHGPLTNAEADLVKRINLAIDEERVKDRSGKTVDLKLDGGLIDQDCSLMYPVRDEIPCLLIDEAIPLDQFDRDGNAP